MSRRSAIWLIVSSILILNVSILIAASPSQWDKEAQARKAEYHFLEAQSAYSNANYDKYLSLLERAYALDSTDIDIAGEWAMIALMDNNADSLAINKAYSLIKRRFLSNPSNYTSGVIVASVAQEQMRFDDAVRVWEMLDSIYPKRPDIPQELARAYLRSYMMGDSSAFNKAMSIYDRIQEGAGRSTELTSQRINAYYIKNDTVAVINELDSLYAHAPNDSYTALFLGVHYQYLNMPDSAIKYYDRACELDSTFGPAYLQRAKFYNAQGDSIGFDREVFHALESQSLDVDSKIGILRSYVSELYTDSLQEPRIRQLFNDLQLMHAGEPEIHSLYGAYLYERKDFAGASEQFSYVTALNPTDESAWMSYIQTSALAEDTTAVVNGGQEAMARFPHNLYFPTLVANVYRLSGDEQKALDIFNSVDVSDVRNPEAVSIFLTNKGDLYALTGDTITALQVYDQAIDLNPDNSMALNNAAYFMTLSNNDLDKAEKYSARSLVGDELNPTYLDTYAWVFFKKKDYKMAKHYIDIALNSYSIATVEADTIPVESYNGDLADVKEFINGNEEDSGLDVVVDEVEEEIVDAPTADIYDHAGDIYFMNGETEKALEFWQKAHELDPDDTLIEKKVKLKTIFFR